MKKVYISPSLQDKNIGVGTYGTEEQRMHEIGNKLFSLIKEKASDVIDVRINQREMSLMSACEDSNKWGAELHLAIHSDAGPAAATGTSVFYAKESTNGKAFAELVLKEMSDVIVSKDRGCMADTVLHAGGLYELRNTRAVAALIEVGFHTNLKESVEIIEKEDQIALALFKAIYKQVTGKDYQEPKVQELKPDWKTQGVDYLMEKGYITQRRDPNTPVDFGTLGTILKNIESKGK